MCSVRYDRVMHTLVMGYGSVDLPNKVVVCGLIRSDKMSQYFPREILGHFITIVL